MSIDQGVADQREREDGFRIGARVEKKSGSSWTGIIVGGYSTSLTPIGWAVESENEPGSVQIYPEKALRLAALTVQPRPQVDSLREGLQVLADLRGRIAPHEPDRVRWEGEWHYGPLATAYIQTVKAVADAADTMLAALLPQSAEPSPEMKLAQMLADYDSIPSSDFQERYSDFCKRRDDLKAVWGDGAALLAVMQLAREIVEPAASPQVPTGEPSREGVYVASRASIPERAAMWRALRASGVTITSSWIDEDGEGQTEDWSELWSRIEREVKRSRALILYAEPSDFPLKGAFVEAGIAIAAGVPVYVVAPGVALGSYGCRPIGSWASHPLVTYADSVEQALAHITSPQVQP